MRLYQIILFFISCSIINAQHNIDRLLRRQLKIVYDDEDDFAIQFGQPLLPRYAGLLEDLDIEVDEMLRRDLFRVLKDLHNKKDKEKTVSEGDNHNEGTGDTSGEDSGHEEISHLHEGDAEPCDSEEQMDFESE